jgi:hypothetical protein
MLNYLKIINAIEQNFIFKDFINLLKQSNRFNLYIKKKKFVSVT